MAHGPGEIREVAPRFRFVAVKDENSIDIVQAKKEEKVVQAVVGAVDSHLPAALRRGGDEVADPSRLSEKRFA